MGTYLSTPVTTKAVDSGESDKGAVPLAWGVVDMQGWRKSMEDAHIARTDVDFMNDPNSRVFGVFDGHGGPEVARFCALYLVSCLQQQPTGIKAGDSLVQSFHALDRMLDDKSGQRAEELQRLRCAPPTQHEQREAVNIPPMAAAAAASPEAEEPCVAQEVVAVPPAFSGADPPETAVVVETGEEEKESSEEESSREAKEEEPVTENEDDDSEEAAGKDQASELDQDLSSDDETDEGCTDIVPVEAEPAKVTGMFQRLLKMSGAPAAAATGQVVLNAVKNSDPASAAASAAADKPNSSMPSVVRNGQLFCNLPDHSLHAGATAIVATICEKTLTVANAGDSRAVLCRSGTALPLSFDHKPMNQVEWTRIRNAGGFVNSFGRVNGNLNLSRSIGDLKYKQVPGLLPSDQMITAEPDIVEVTIQDSDEFLILGCDGIWDCLTNEGAVAFVRSRIATMSPVEIGVEMLDSIISTDPRVTQGIGGDNMTIMIIDFQPDTRTYRGSSAPAVTGAPNVES